MPTYRVLVRGSNLLMDVDGGRGRYAFEVRRFVDAESPAAAAERALGLVRAAPQVARGARNPAGDPPVCAVEAVEALPAGEAAPATQPGFLFRRDEAGDRRGRPGDAAVRRRGRGS